MEDPTVPEKFLTIIIVPITTTINIISPVVTVCWGSQVWLGLEQERNDIERRGVFIYVWISNKLTCTYRWYKFSDTVNTTC